MTVKMHTAHSRHRFCSSHGKFWIILPIVWANEEALQRLPVPR